MSLTTKSGQHNSYGIAGFFVRVPVSESQSREAALRPLQGAWRSWHSNLRFRNDRDLGIDGDWQPSSRFYGRLGLFRKRCAHRLFYSNVCFTNVHPGSSGAGIVTVDCTGQLVIMRMAIIRRDRATDIDGFPGDVQGRAFRVQSLQG